MLVTVSAGKDKALHLYELQPESGKLVQHAKYDLPGSPGSQFVNPDGQRLYVSVRSANSVAAYRIDRAGKNWFRLASQTSVPMPLMWQRIRQAKRCFGLVTAAA